MKKTADENKKNPIITEQKIKYEESVSRIAIENMLYKDLPPAFVTIMGPSKCGKTTLLRSIVKQFSHKKIENFNGPVTLLTSKTKRMCIFESKSDIHQYVDTSKISDVFIFVINAKNGFEMDTFEALSLLMAHGLSKVLCVVTNAGDKSDTKYLKSIKKRIWSEICPGIKVFNLNNVESGVYTDREIVTFCNTLGAMKSRPIEWKCKHPHIVVDKIDKEHNLYGYIRGGLIKKGDEAHIPGFGDVKIEEIEVVNDPVPIKGSTKLSIQSRTVYSPMVDGLIDDSIAKEEVVNFEIEADDDIKLFSKSFKTMENNSAIDENTNEEEIEKNMNEEEYKGTDSIEEDESDEGSVDLDELKTNAAKRFQKTAVTEEELVEKFNKKYTEAEKKNANFLLDQKEKIKAQWEKNEKINLPNIFKPGNYVKIVLDKKLPLDLNFSKAIIIGVFLVSEKEITTVQGKIKRHKWNKKLLKTNEAVIFSLGWRRFQSVPIFSFKDATRNRYIKYSLEAMHSSITFYGPVVPAGTGFSVYTTKAPFKVLATGTVTDVGTNPMIVKKLKLVGYPQKILKNTVIVKSMFTSDLEVSKFIGASLKSGSGLRGQVKGFSGKNGDFRATFEGEMLMSDIIALRCFVPVEIYKFFVPVDNLCKTWTGLRKLYEIREDLGIKHPYEEEGNTDDSEEENIIQNNRNYDLPSNLEKQLPFDKREIKVISDKIDLPVAPDAKNSIEFKKNIEQMRIDKDEKERKELEIRKKQWKKLHEEAEVRRKEGKEKSIVTACREKEKKYGKKLSK